MKPDFSMQTTRVIAEIKIIAPLLISAAFGIKRPRNMGLAFVVELILFSVFSAVRAMNVQHG
jgi:hypothetical protein